jgi:hypothetical protein
MPLPGAFKNVAVNGFEMARILGSASLAEIVSVLREFQNAAERLASEFRKERPTKQVVVWQGAVEDQEAHEMCSPQSLDVAPKDSSPDDNSLQLLFRDGVQELV